MCLHQQQVRADEKAQVAANCDHLARLKFSPVRPRALTEHGAIMAATVLNRPRAFQMSLRRLRVFGCQGDLIRVLLEPWAQ